MIITETNIKEYPLLTRGKVRDVYDLGQELLLVASDRISAFDFVLPTPIPDKGKILTQISAFFFELTKDILPNHLITTEVSKYPAELQPYREILDGRSMLVKKAKRLDVECVVRGYLAGSGFKDYKKTQSLCGIKLPAGLVEGDKLPADIFTPSSKAEQGWHDENITLSEVEKLVGKKLAVTLKEKSLAVYQKAREFAKNKGIILADTKFEFGLLDQELILIDEIFTPDSSRFWDANTYKPGAPQPSYDKQFIRDYLEGINWNKQPPVPELPEDIVAKTRLKYLEAYQRLTGKKL
ncbi:MAG: phosphoribosylaminoimidazolesuccinocarboxamide synthase [Elusimicrobia bacterium]|nr:phosphoribosylaminoimidazolesuccinocarboxamide synthase [Elusimicrobiota bacterium]